MEFHKFELSKELEKNLYQSRVERPIKIVCLSHQERPFIGRLEIPFKREQVEAYLVGPFLWPVVSDF